jgi:hypothetical protein
MSRDVVVGQWDTCLPSGGRVCSMLPAGALVFEQNHTTRQFIGFVGFGLITKCGGMVLYGIRGDTWCHYRGCVKVKQLREDCVTAKSKF